MQKCCYYARQEDMTYWGTLKTVCSLKVPYFLHFGILTKKHFLSMILKNHSNSGKTTGFKLSV